MKKRTRPPKLTDERIEMIGAALMAGNYMDTCAALAGIDRETLRLWMRRGRDELDRRGCGQKAQRGNAKHVKLVRAIDMAVAQGEASNLNIIRKAGKEHWQAVAWMLERRFPEKWGKKVRIGAKIADLPSSSLKTSL